MARVRLISTHARQVKSLDCLRTFPSSTMLVRISAWSEVRAASTTIERNIFSILIVLALHHCRFEMMDDNPHRYFEVIKASYLIKFNDLQHSKSSKSEREL